jgi:hypothetical protein
VDGSRIAQSEEELLPTGPQAAMITAPCAGRRTLAVEGGREGVVLELTVCEHARHPLQPIGVLSSEETEAS